MAHGPANGGAPVGTGTTNALTKWSSSQVVSTANMQAPWVDVLSYGADPTGVLDSTTAIQNAINALQPGGILWVNPGTYKISGTLTLTTYHIQITGASKQDCTFKTSSATADVLQMNSWYCSISNITFDSSVTRTAGIYVKMITGNNRHVVYNCEFNNGFIGIEMDSHISSITNCEFRTFVAGSTWIYINCPASSAHDMTIEDITGDNGSNLAGSSGIQIVQCSSLLMSNCSLVHAGTLGSIYFNPGATSIIPSVKVSNVFFDQSGYGCQMAGTAGGIIQRITFVGCWFTSSTNDGVLLNNALCQDIKFVGCEFYGNGANGINATNYADWTVTASTFSGNVTTGIKTTAIAAGSFGIQENFIGNNAGAFGANGLGINIQAGAYSSYVIKGNRGLDLNTTGGITDSGTVTGFKQKFTDDNYGSLYRGQLAAIVAATAGINSTETIVVGGLNNCPIPANSLQIGDTIRVTLLGTCTSTAANASTIALRFGTAGTTADALILTGATTVLAAVSGTAIPFKVVVDLTIRTLGSGTSGTCAGQFVIENQGTAANAAAIGIQTCNTQLIAMTATGFNTTVNNYLSATYKAAATTTTCTFQVAIIEKL